MNAEELEVAYTTNNSIQAEIIKNFLVDEGIPCQIGGERQMELTGIIEVELLVHESDVERARDLIAQHETIEPESDEPNDEDAEGADYGVAEDA